MAESVKAYLDQNGFHHIPVFRLKEEHIGCSLAESAEAVAYEQYLRNARAELDNPLHVVYINTSLKTKADTHNIIPTITCTSSNVVKTILQAAAEMPSVNIVYGPDTYMGGNIHQLLTTLAKSDDETVAKLHPAHDVASIKKLLSQYHYFKQGICVVHHMFGADVTEKVQHDFPLDDPNTFYTAHFEVPGEMFGMATEAATQKKGVVGSTSNILNFITDRAAEGFDDVSKPKKFILGTEVGMVTGIVKSVQDTLRSTNSDGSIEIVFPVAAEAMAQTGDADMPVAPGVKGGEGCSTAGGCATCPFMKMNDLDALCDVTAAVEMEAGGERVNMTTKLDGLTAKVPEGGVTDKGNDIVDGTKPIGFMRGLMSDGKYPDELKSRVLSLKATGAPIRGKSLLAVRAEELAEGNAQQQM
jgi:quinolinate synthase